MTKIILRKNKQSQHGVVLVIALLLLLVLSLLAIATVDKVSISERMAGNERDITSAFQAAEAALLEGERWIQSLPGTTPPGTVTTCTGPGCSTAVFNSRENGNANDSARMVSGAEVNWIAIPWATRGRLFSNDANAANNLAGLSSAPRYIIEYLGPTLIVGTSVHYFRITTRAVGISPNSEIILQSVYRRTFP